MKIILSTPRGFCAGVFNAVDIVEKCLETFGKPIYILKEIVHNKTVVDRLAQKGALSIQSIDQAPENSYLVFSAHGVPPQFHQIAKSRNIKVIDATCPLVTKVHLEALRFAKLGYTILYIGHKGHDEVVGVLAEVPHAIHLIQDPTEAKTFNLPESEKNKKLIYLTQTTLSVYETKEIIQILKSRFGTLEDPPNEDICYATTNRQNAVADLSRVCDLILVVGSQNSSNSQRLRELAEQKGIASYLIDSTKDIKKDWFAGKNAVGITAGASAPEDLVQEIVKFIQQEFNVREVEDLITEKEEVHFPLPKVLREALAQKIK
jgi:4-hydroxy-3-methylbut-2-enyl diphosphate reductase